jgi:hypothetical protein
VYSTSCWTLVELINGIRKDNAQYCQRKAAIYNLLNSEISIDWKLFESKLSDSFPTLKSEDKRVSNLKRLLNLARINTSLQNFKIDIKKKRLLKDMTYFEEYDDELSKGFIKASTSLKDNIRTIFEKESKNSASRLPENIRNGSYIDFLRGFQKTDLNFLKTFYIIVKNTARHISNEPTEAKINKLYNSYNNSINIYICALSYKSIEYEINGSDPRRNDAADLAHFLYIATGTTLVTEDRGMRKLAESINIEVVSIANLLDLHK